VSAKKFKMPDVAISKLREAMKKRWQDPEYRRKVVDGLHKKWAAKKSVKAGEKGVAGAASSS
jgi:hypothetical protein